MDAYIRRTLLNAYLDERRRPWRREQAVAAVPDQPTTAAELPDPGTRQRILAALAAIPPRQRAALVLRFWADMSVEQVADLLHCSAGTVKSQTARGLERLREVLGHDLLAELKEHR
jgi:RNA polymerase sigma factor (sigma-70 family)